MARPLCCEFQVVVYRLCMRLRLKQLLHQDSALSEQCILVLLAVLHLSVFHLSHHLYQVNPTNQKSYFFPKKSFRKKLSAFRSFHASSGSPSGHLGFTMINKRTLCTAIFA